MIRNYLKIAIRSLMKNKVYSIINILGLSIGLATSIIIALYIANELSYDSHNTKADRIALFQQFPNSSSSGSSFSELLRKRAGIETTTQISPNRALISKENLAAYEPNFCLVDSNLINVFDFPMQSGALNEAINQPNKIALSERMAIKYFASKSPIGQTIDVQLTNKIPCTVVGVFRNIPQNSHLKIEFIASSKNAKQLLNIETKTYWDFAGMTYILFNKKDSFNKFLTQLPAIQKATNDQNAQAWKLSIIPLRDIYLKNRTDDRIKATNAIEFVRIFSAIAICILLLACFNYINLGLARATLRAKEVGVRKVIGAARKQLIGQFLGESFLFTGISVLLALVLIHLGIPYINIFFDKHLSTIQFSEPIYISYLLIFVVLISLFTGIYPAFALSSYKPIQALKNYINPKSSLSLFRRSMVVFQFTISIAILVATMVVMNQLRYMQTKDLGYDREQILTLKAPAQSTENQKNIVENELSKLTDVKEITQVSILPGSGIGFNKVSTLSLKNNQMDPTIGQLYVDDKFLKVFNVKLLEGRFFNNNSAADNQNYVVNKEAIKKFGWQIGQTIGYVKYEYSPNGGYMEVPVNGQIIGIVDNYNQMDLKSPIFPIMMIRGIANVFPNFV